VNANLGEAVGGKTAAHGDEKLPRIGRVLLQKETKRKLGALKEKET